MAKLTAEERARVKENPIDRSLAEKINPRKGIGIVTERIDLEPGDFIDTDTVILYKIGNGARGHTYAALRRTDSREDIETAVLKCMPFATRQHYLTPLIREARKVADPTGANRYVDHYTPLIERLREEIKNTNPVNDRKELRHILGTPGFELAVCKLLSNEMMQKDPYAEEDFIKENIMHDKVNYSSIPRVHGLPRRTKKGLVSVVDFIYGRTPSEIINPAETWWRNTPKGYKDCLPPEFVLGMAHDLASVLRRIEECGVIYQDIQHGNIMIGFDGEFHIIDFGFTEELTPDKKKLEMIGGDHHFMAPELIKYLQEVRKDGSVRYDLTGEPDYHPNGRVFSVGVLNWVLMHDGRDYPFEGKPFSRLQEKIMKGSHTPISNPEYTALEKEWLVTRPLNKDPEKRPSFAELEHVTKELYERRINSRRVPTREYRANFMKPLKEMIDLSYKNTEEELPMTPIAPPVLELNSMPSR